jgi:hypothetical protein
MSIIKLAVSAFAITSLVVAVPTASTTGVSSTFSFSNWVESIIANPDGDNLSPEQVVEAWQASLNNTQADGALQKRFVCNTIAGTEASVSTLLKSGTRSIG